MINSPPEIPPVTIGPSISTAAYELQALHDSVMDVDGDPLTFVCQWTINATTQKITSEPRLEAGIVEGGDSIVVELEVTDGVQSVSVESPPVTVQNAPPEVGAIEILPAGVRTLDELQVLVADLTDADGDGVEISYQWFLNGQSLENQTTATLPSGIAKYPDVVSVRLKLSDGMDSATSPEVNLTLSDTPSLLDRQSIPAALAFAETSTFEVRFVDPEGQPVTTSLIEAPNGMSYNADTGLVSWAPTPFMLNSTEVFHAEFASSDAQTEAIELTVADQTRPPLLAVSGVEVPSENTRLDIGDFDNDGRPEILSTDSIARIFTLEFDGGQIKQDWLYPFGLINSSEIVGLWSHGSEGSQVIVATDTGVFLISSCSRRTRQVFQVEGTLRAAALADLNRDGINELALVNSRRELVVLRSDNWQEYFFKVALQSQDSHPDYSVEIGNVDADPALEIVVNTGEVVDGLSGNVQWLYGDKFGALIAMGDLDGDGDNEILAGDRSDDLTSYDAQTQTTILQYDLNDTCGLHIYNADSDPQQEVFHGACQHGAVEIFDASTGSMVSQQRFRAQAFYSGGDSISLGDIDGDGIVELVFGTGNQSNGEDRMAIGAIAGLGDSTPASLAFHNNPAQTGIFQIAGWTSNAAGEDVAVFSLPETEGGGDGNRIGLLTENGNFTLSGIVKDNRNKVAPGAVIDSSANNGVDGVVVAVDDPRAGGLIHMNLNDFSIQHIHNDLGHDGPFDAEIVSVVVDYREDGSAVAILTTDESQIQVYDISARQSVWTSPAQRRNIYDAITIPAVGGFSIVAATDEELTLWTESDSGDFVKAYTATGRCNYLAELQLEGEIRIACVDLTNRGNGKLRLYSTQLVMLSEALLGYKVTALTSSGDGKLFIASELEFSYTQTDRRSFIRLVNPYTGVAEWTSAALVGTTTGISVLTDSEGELEKLGISTTRAMYIRSP